MSEMLGNQYFMARNYSAAQKEFEEVLSKYPENRSAKKKLVVCYTQTGKLKEAFSFFNDLVRTDIEFIIKTDPIKDDCPCPELTAKLQSHSDDISNSYEHNLSMGIIWLYCDVNHSLKYFTLLHESDPNNSDIENIIHSIHKYLEKDSAVTSRV